MQQFTQAPDDPILPYRPIQIIEAGEPMILEPDIPVGQGIPVTTPVITSPVTPGTTIVDAEPKPGTNEPLPATIVNPVIDPTIVDVYEKMKDLGGSITAPVIDLFKKETTTTQPEAEENKKWFIPFLLILLVIIILYITFKK